MFARCCHPSTSLPMSAQAFVFTGQHYPGGAFIQGYLGGQNGFHTDWLVWDYLFVVRFESACAPTDLTTRLAPCCCSGLSR